MNVRGSGLECLDEQKVDELHYRRLVRHRHEVVDRTDDAQSRSVFLICLADRIDNTLGGGFVGVQSLNHRSELALRAAFDLELGVEENSQIVQDLIIDRIKPGGYPHNAIARLER